MPAAHGVDVSQYPHLEHAHMDDFHFDPQLNEPASTDNSIMWGGMQQLALDKNVPGSWQKGPYQESTERQAAANYISQYGQITPPSDDNRDHKRVKMEDETAGDVSDVESSKPSASSVRPKRTPSKRKTKEDRGQMAAEKPKKTTRKARKGYKATTEEEEADTDGEMKRERFLERNRVAASKCRQKKKHWTNGLEAHARDLAAANAHLNACALSLKEEVLFLKSECLRHTDCDCTRIREYLDRSIMGMSPAGMLGMLPEAENVDHSQNLQPPQRMYDTTSPMDTESLNSHSSHAADADSRSRSRSSGQPKSDQEMRMLLQASIATPESDISTQPSAS